MHEASLINNLIHKIEKVAKEQNSTRVTCVSVKLGALSHFSKEHFKEHFEISSQGTVCEKATLKIELLTDKTDPMAQGILLDKIDVIT